MSKKKNYIKSSVIWKDMYANPDFKGYFYLFGKAPIHSIKIDKSLFDYANEVDPSQVSRIVSSFYRDAWMPIMVNTHFYLLDGQHRLAVARELGLKYIDVVIQVTDNRLPKPYRVRRSK